MADGAPMSPVGVQTKRIIIETDRYRIEGDITILQGSYRNSLAEYMANNSDEFLSMTNVELVSLDGSGRDWTSSFLFLNKRHIRSISPKDSATS